MTRIGYLIGVLGMVLWSSCQQLDISHFTLDKNSNGEIFDSYETAGDTIGLYDIQHPSYINFDFDKDGESDLTLLCTHSPGMVVNTYSIHAYTVSPEYIAIATENMVDTICTYAVYPNATDTFFYEQNYSVDSIYPAGYSLHYYTYNHVTPFQKGSIVNVNDISFGTSSDITLNFADYSHYSEGNMDLYINMQTGPWLGNGRKCLVFKFQTASGKNYYGWIEIQVIEPYRFIYYGYYVYEQ